jgi:hypothetical protein
VEADFYHYDTPLSWFPRCNGAIDQTGIGGARKRVLHIDIYLPEPSRQHRDLGHTERQEGGHFSPVSFL